MTSPTDGPVANPPAEVVIGLDVGTTAVKCSAFGLGRPWRTTVVREYPLLHPQPGWAIQDPDVIVAALMGALAECVQRCGAASVIAISLSSAMHGLIGLDAELKPLTPLITWVDSRAADQARELRATPEGLALHRTSGTPIHSMSPLIKLIWFARFEPELCSQARAWTGLKAYVIHALTGSLVEELSCASGTGLMDLRTRSWNPAALELAGVREDQMPPIMPTTAAFGLAQRVAARIGLPTGTPVVTGAGDGPLGNLGTGAMTDGVAGLSIGTSGALRMVLDEPVVDPGGRLFCYALTDTQWVTGGAVSNGGAVVRWAGGVFGSDLATSGTLGGVGGEPRHQDAALLDLAASVPAGSDGLLMLPYLLAERAPLWNPDLTGAYLGIRHAHTRGHFIRAAVEGVALQLALVADDLDRIRPITSIRATGGVFRSALWRQVCAGVLGRPLTVVGGTEGTALGACALALVGLGRVQRPVDGLSLLGASQDGDGQTSTVSPQESLTAQYRSVRADIPRLLSQLAEIGALHAASA